MSIVKCTECQAEVSTLAGACPQCGAIRTPGVSWRRVLVMLAIGLALFYWLGTTYTGSFDENLEPIAAPTP